MKLVVDLSGAGTVNKFCEVAQGFDYDVDVCYGHYTLDGKNVLSVKSIPLTEEVSVYVRGIKLNNGEPERILAALGDFIKK